MFVPALAIAGAAAPGAIATACFSDRDPEYKRSESSQVYSDHK